jgi:hypothetical protein
MAKMKIIIMTMVYQRGIDNESENMWHLENNQAMTKMAEAMAA